MLRFLPAALLLAGLSLKVVLLLTSQSMADGDEAVSGIMAMDILESGSHPVYPYGIRYGAGAGVEAHLAAVLFAVLGVSDVALKAAGLLIWGAGLATLFLIGRSVGGADAGWIAALLYTFAPPMAQWSLKVAGGQNVAVLLCLLACLAIERGARGRLVVLLLPLAAVAHPIAAAFAAILAVYLVARDRGRERLWTAGSLVAACGLAALFFWPREIGVWNPAARAWNAAALADAAGRAALRLFSGHPSSDTVPGPVELAVSLIWLASTCAALVIAKERKRPILYALAPLGIIPVVDPAALVARHLLVVVPFACLLLATSLGPPGRWRLALFSLLLVSGGALQAGEIASPNIYGAGIQNRGVLRSGVVQLIREIEGSGVGHVYCTDPMFQWNIVFGSRKRVLARWRDPRDRVPEFVAAVDRARLAGRPVGLVRPARDRPRDAPQVFEWTVVPRPEQLERLFPLAPGVTAP